MSRFTVPITARTGNRDLDRVLSNHYQILRELLATNLVTARLIEGVELENATAKLIPHGFERPVRVFWSPPQGSTSAGRIREIRDAETDRNRYVKLRADGYGATVTLDLLVM